MSGKGMDLFPDDENSQGFNLADFNFDTGSQSQDTGYQNKNTEAKALFESSSDEEKYSASDKAGYVDEQEKKIFEDPNLREAYKKGLLERLRVLMPDSEFEEIQKLTQEYTSEQIDELSQGQSQNVNEVTSFEVNLDDDDLDFNVNEHFSTISPIKYKTGNETGQNPDTNDVVNDMKSMFPNVIQYASKASSTNLKENNPVDKIVKILNRGGIGVPRSTIRPAITDKIGDAQQMIDMWGKHITDYAKGGEAKCYLCNLKIVPLSSCPEMEHKYPVASAYSAMRPYRELKAYIGKKENANGEPTTMYKLWNTYINDPDNNSALRQLYIAINEGIYDADEVDNKYEEVFDNFWMTTKYGKFWKRENNKLVIDFEEVMENVTIKVLNHILSLKEDEINTTLERLLKRKERLLKRKQNMPEDQEERTKMLEEELVGLENVINLEHNQQLLTNLQKEEKGQDQGYMQNMHQPLYSHFF